MVPIFALIDLAALSSCEIQSVRELKVMFVCSAIRDVEVFTEVMISFCRGIEEDRSDVRRLLSHDEKD